MSIKPKKSLGQHFLIDHNILDKISRSPDSGADTPVIEIGPGTGALTRYLLKKYKKLTVIEVDKRAVEVLNDTFPGLEIIGKDILEVEWSDFIKDDTPRLVVGNLPYYLTSPILFKVLDHSHYFREAVFMIQKEVGDRIVAKQRSKEYGILSVQLQRLASVKLLFNVSRNAFRPKPDVESCVIRLTFDRPALVCSVTYFKLVVRTAFNQRRKKLSNSLKLLTGDVDLPDDIKDKRAEELSPDDFEKLTLLLQNKGVFD
ncbi:MAG: 16S rRNA (adenine(1518)-N(6)/adenine(1519)-N(6))-dimethyltransferase RsmA [Cyclonatronaceae bacterium]